MAKTCKVTTLLALYLTLATGSSAQRDVDQKSQFWHAEGQLGSKDIAGRLDRVVRQIDPQNPPPTTSTPVCDQFDNYFYVTPRNYTWQLQCTTNYEGTIVQQIETEGYAECIVSCAYYNRANGAGACIGINFNGPNDNVIGLCTQFSTVVNLLLANEEGNVQDSALLVYSPNGTVFATPRPNPSFSDRPTHPPTVVPLSSATVSDFTTVLFTTSVITLTDCPLGALPCPLTPTATTSVLNSTLMGTPVPPSASTPLTSSEPTFSVTHGGTRPSSTTSGPITSTTTIPSNSVVRQVTFSEVITYTAYYIQAVVFCPSAPAPCTQTTATISQVGFRTQLSCDPGICTGLGIVTNNVVDITAATCIETT